MGMFGGSSSNAEKSANALNLIRAMEMGGIATDNARRAASYASYPPSSDVQYKTASGYYLNANPYINRVAQQAVQNIQDNYNKSYIPSALSSYAGSGRFGSGLFQRTLADTQHQMNEDVGNAINNLYYTNYNQERAYQESALSRMGSQYDPLNRSALLGSIVTGSTPSYQVMGEQASKAGGALAGAAAGAAAGSMFGPWGTAIGAVGGGVLGALA